jgi:hypothetical protein
VHQVGDHRQTRRSGGQLPGAQLGEELHQGVDGQEVDPGARVELLTRKDVEQVLEHALRSLVPIGDRVREELAFPVDPAVVDPPRIDAQTRQLRRLETRKGHGAPQSCANSGPEFLEVPAQVPPRPARGTPKAVDLVQANAIVARSPEHDATPARPQIDGEPGALSTGRASTTSRHRPQTMPEDVPEAGGRSLPLRAR